LFWLKALQVQNATGAVLKNPYKSTLFDDSIAIFMKTEFIGRLKFDKSVNIFALIICVFYIMI
jgi:hypothetical protein